MLDRGKKSNTLEEVITDVIGMLGDSLPMETIARYSGLSVEEVRTIQDC